MIRIVIDEPSSLGMVINVETVDYSGTPSDADTLALAEAILASDFVQHAPQWNGTPILTSVGVDTIRGIYPTA